MGKHQTNDLIVDSIGVCAAFPAGKKQQPCILVVYMTKGGEEVAYTAMPLPAKNKTYSREDFLDAVARAEEADRITYLDAVGCPRDVFVVRAQEGMAVDIAPREPEHNCFSKGIAEIAAVHVPFDVEAPASAPKPFTKNALTMALGAGQQSEIDGYAYALANAYNACLLGQIFAGEELALTDGAGAPVKIEVRAGRVEFNDGALYFKPVSTETGGIVNSYESEEFDRYDGEKVSTCSYRIAFKTRLGRYSIEKRVRT